MEGMPRLVMPRVEHRRPSEEELEELSDAELELENSGFLVYQDPTQSPSDCMLTAVPPCSVPLCKSGFTAQVCKSFEPWKVGN